MCITNECFDVQLQVSTFEIGIAAIPVEHDLRYTLVHQLVVLGPATTPRQEREKTILLIWSKSNLERESDHGPETTYRSHY